MHIREVIGYVNPKLIQRIRYGTHIVFDKLIITCLIKVISYKKMKTKKRVKLVISIALNAHISGISRNNIHLNFL